MENKEVTQVMDRNTVEQAIDFILAEGRSQGYNEAMKTYGQQYKEIIKTGRKQGLIIGLILSVVAFVAFKIGKKKYDEKKTEEAKSKEPINVDPEIYDEKKEE